MALAQKRVRVAVVTYNGARKEGSPLEDLKGVEIVPCMVGHGPPPVYVLDQVLEFCGDFQPDVIHGHHFDGGMLGAFVAAARNVPMVLTMHKPPKVTIAEHSVSSPRYARSATYAVWRYLATDPRINAHVAYSKIYIKENKEIGVPRRRIEPIFHGVPVAYLRRKAGTLPKTKRLQLAVDASIVLCPLRPEKPGVGVFLEAAATVRQKLANRRVVFVVTGDPRDGSDEARDQARRSVRLADDLHLTGSVIFRRFTLRQMWDVMKMSAVCVIPSQREGLSIAALEAMAIGTPVVASEVMGLDEVVVDWKTGLLAAADKPKEFADRIIKILSDEQLRQRLIRGADRRVRECFSAERMAEQHLQLYKRLARKH
jgi:glycosyltransferase involved in cell wall biosynthesis